MSAFEQLRPLYGLTAAPQCLWYRLSTNIVYNKWLPHLFAKSQLCIVTSPTSETSGSR